VSDDERSVKRSLRCTVAPLMIVAACLALPFPLIAGPEVSPVPAEGEAVRHLRLLRSEPAKDSTVTESPRELRLWFSQRPEIAMTTARISRGNHSVAVGRAAIRPWDGEGVLVVVPIQSRLENGRHVVTWRTMAPDGHVITGEFAFTVAVRGATGRS
jgi:methionine-rich copper-binding protein CopC